MCRLFRQREALCSLYVVISSQTSSQLAPNYVQGSDGPQKLQRNFISLNIIRRGSRSETLTVGSQEFLATALLQDLKPGILLLLLNYFFH